MRIAPPIELTQEERAELTRWSRGRSTQARCVERARIVLLAADGKNNQEIGRQLGIDLNKVSRWRRRFAESRLAGIEKDLPRGGRKPTRRAAVDTAIITKVTQTKPKNATHWSTRTLAKELGINQTMVHRVLKANGLQPHMTRTFKLSNDPQFEEKLCDVVGLYLSPPDNALVLSVDEKSSIQALDRTQPSLPFVKGRCGTMTHDYKRNGTTTLFASIELGFGEVIARCMPRHRHQEWIKFLKAIDEETPSELDLHLIVDNYATHKHPKVREWLDRHRRFHVHFIPTSSSWLNVIERFFRDLDQKRLKRGAFRSVRQLEDAIKGYIDAHNEEPKPIVWTATVEKILDKVGRARAALDNHQTG
ncbi:MAG: IS630 family transposase [Dehalococcoidia bacterium]|nr:IS630 family transposase [Dehalococcoidia bacterium]